MTSSLKAPSETLVDGSGAPTLGVFDSGLGGLSVLHALRAALPGVPMLYVADSAWAPYGERTDAEIAVRSLCVAQALVDAGASALVVACNTATAMAVAKLRSRWPALAIIGVEPGLKPALAATRNGRIGVMATEATLRSDRFLALLRRVLDAAEREQARTLHVHLQPCPGLAGAIERADLQSPELALQLRHWCGLLRAAEVDTVVLGCTHYPIVAPLIARELGPQVVLIDTAEAVARQAARRWSDTILASPSTLPVPAPGTRLQPPVRASVRYFCSGELIALRRAAVHWLGESDPVVERLAC